MLALSIQAPFAVFRTFTAGWYRPTATFLTPSAAYGLILNLAGVETRLCESEEGHPGTVSASLMRTGLPHVKLALGLPASAEHPRVATVYQQLHNYPVGSSGNERAKTTFGNKYNITPVRRELLTNLHAVVLMDGNADLEDSVRKGLRGETVAERYGLPFLGDNAFLPDRIDLIEELPATYWFEQVTADTTELRHRTTRLTIWIDRADFSRTKSALYAPTEVASPDVPAAAWTLIAPQPSE